MQSAVFCGDIEYSRWQYNDIISQNMYVFVKNASIASHFSKALHNLPHSFDLQRKTTKSQNNNRFQRNNRQPALFYSRREGNAKCSERKHVWKIHPRKPRIEGRIYQSKRNGKRGDAKGENISRMSQTEMSVREINVRFIKVNFISFIIRSLKCSRRQNCNMHIAYLRGMNAEL